MNLVSCGDCGVVIDKDKILFPHCLVKEDGSINQDSATWDGDDYVAYIPCPVCSGTITEGE